MPCSSETRGGLDEHDSVAISEHDGGLKMIYSYPLNLQEKQKNLMITPPTYMHVTIRTFAFPLILKVYPQPAGAHISFISPEFQYLGKERATSED